MKNIYGSRCKWRCVSNVHCVTFTPFFVVQPPIGWRFRFRHVSILLTWFEWHWQMAISTPYARYTQTQKIRDVVWKWACWSLLRPLLAFWSLAILIIHHRFTSKTSHHHDWHGYCFNGCALKTNIWSIEVSAEEKYAIFIVSFIWKCHWHNIFIRSAFVRHFIYVKFRIVNTNVTIHVFIGIWLCVVRKS